MIKDVEINNFKSVKHLYLDCKRINIFIGEPNTGKSNILETLGVFSFGCCVGGYEGNIQNFVRFERMSNLFYDENLDDNRASCKSTKHKEFLRNWDNFMVKYAI